MSLSPKNLILLVGGAAAALLLCSRSFARNTSNDETPGREETAAAIAFVGKVAEAAKSPRGREFLRLAAEPRNPGLRECYQLVRAIEIGADPDWKVIRRKDDGWFHVTFRTRTGSRVMVVLRQDAGQWKFVFAAQS